MDIFQLMVNLVRLLIFLFNDLNKDSVDSLKIFFWILWRPFYESYYMASSINPFDMHWKHLWAMQYLQPDCLKLISFQSKLLNLIFWIFSHDSIQDLFPRKRIVESFKSIVPGSLYVNFADFDLLVMISWKRS